MNELYQMQVAAIREVVPMLSNQVAEMSLSQGIETKVRHVTDELEMILAEDSPDLEEIRDLVASIWEILDGTRPILLH
jgi:hypothetical protein